MNDRDLTELFDANGNVITSSQLRFEDDDRYRHTTVTMEGIVVAVKPSDDSDNLSSNNTSDKRGFRHECTVLIVDVDGEPCLLLENVVIPPRQHSGIDDFEEDLPRGVTGHVDKQKLSANWKHLDWSRLDGEHCIVSFLGNNIDKPYISNWWPHPANKFDPATSGQACLTQVDPKKNLSRAMRRVNGTLQMVTKDGDIYVNTNEAASTVEITPKYKRFLKDKGGSIQVDIKKSQQLEINWNIPVEGLKAGSTSASQEREADLPHVDHSKAVAAMTPDKRETSRTFIRHTQFSMFEKTSNYTIWCEDTSSNGGEEGNIAVLADDRIDLFVRKGSDPTVDIHVEKGVIQLLNDDGTRVDVLNDAVHIVTKSGGRISIEGGNITVAGKTDMTGPVAIGGGAGQPVVNANTYQLAESLVMFDLTAYLKLAGEAWAAVLPAIADPTGQGKVTAAKAAAEKATTSTAIFLAKLLLANASPFTTKNLTSS